MPRRCDAIDAAPRNIPHPVPADARIVPVGDEDAAVRGDADIARAEPGVGAREHQRLVEFVAGTLGLLVEAADLARAGVGVDELAAELLGQQAAFVAADAGGAAETGAE